MSLLLVVSLQVVRSLVGLPAARIGAKVCPHLLAAMSVREVLFQFGLVLVHFPALVAWYVLPFCVDALYVTIEVHLAGETLTAEAAKHCTGV